MPKPLPFPFPVHIGTDICHVPRILRILTGPHGERFVEKVLNEKERDQVKWRELWEGRHRGDVQADNAAEKEKFEDRHETEADKVKKSGSVAGLLDWRDATIRNAFQQETGKQLDNTRGEGEGSRKAEVKDVRNTGMESVARFLGGRWAAKEATIKAHPQFPLSMQEITVLATRYGPLYSFIRRKHWISEPAREVRVSISHDGEYASAVCMAAEEPRFGHGEIASLLRAEAENEDENDDRVNGENLRNRRLGGMRKGGIALHVSNLPAGITEQELLDAFATFPTRAGAFIPKGQEEQDPKYGFVMFKYVRGVVRAVTDEVVVGGRVVEIRVAKKMMNRNGLQELGLARKSSEGLEIPLRKLISKSIKTDKVPPKKRMGMERPRLWASRMRGLPNLRFQRRRATNGSIRSRAYGLELRRTASKGLRRGSTTAGQVTRVLEEVASERWEESGPWETMVADIEASIDGDFFTNEEDLLRFTLEEEEVAEEKKRERKIEEDEAAESRI